MRKNLENAFPVTGAHPSGRSRQASAEVFSTSPWFRETLAEREEILRLKWLESEKAGRDIGLHAAILRWVRWHRDEWRAAYRRQTRLIA